MRNVDAVRMAIVSMAVLLSGCDLGKSILSSPAERINAAFPVSDAARVAEASALEIATDVQKKEIKSQLKELLKQRALNCAQGYLPTWHSSVEDIRRAVTNKSCFSDADDEIAQWLSMRKVDLLLSWPPLVPVPGTVPASINADGFIQDARFAEHAGIAMLATPQTIELVDIATSKLISSETSAGKQAGALSPNGRLYVTGNRDGMKIKSVETGGVVAEIKSVHPYQFFWLGDQVAAYSKQVLNTYLIDYASGKEIPLPQVLGYLFMVEKVPGHEHQYAFFYNNKIAVIELERNETGPTVKLVSETAVSGPAWTSSNSGHTVDGRYYFSAAGDLTLMDTDQMQAETIPFAPFELQTAIATPDPDKLLLTGFISPPRSDDPIGIYLYSISGQTMSRVDQEKIFPPRYLYIPSLDKQGIINNSKILVRDELPTLDTTTLTEFVSNTLVISSQRKQYASDRQRAAQFTRNGVYPGQPYSPSVSTSSSGSGGSNSVMARLARNAQVEGVGIYQGKSAGQSGAGHPRGYVEVHVRRSIKPIVLVLSSYEPVNWHITPSPDAKIAAVLVSGYYSSKVDGAGDARVLVVGSAYAYKTDTPQYYQLNNEVIKMIGKGMDIFQGQYEGGEFSVGGN